MEGYGVGRGEGRGEQASHSDLGSHLFRNGLHGHGLGALNGQTQRARPDELHRVGGVGGGAESVCVVETGREEGGKVGECLSSHTRRAVRLAGVPHPHHH